MTTPNITRPGAARTSLIIVPAGTMMSVTVEHSDLIDLDTGDEYVWVTESAGGSQAASARTR